MPTSHDIADWPDADVPEPLDLIEADWDTFELDALAMHFGREGWKDQ